MKCRAGSNEVQGVPKKSKLVSNNDDDENNYNDMMEMQSSLVVSLTPPLGAKAGPS